MVNFTLKSLPKVLHKMLKEQAKRNHRSLNSEIIACLEKVTSKKPDAETVLKTASRLRQGLSLHITDKELEKFKAWGRL